MQCLLSSAYLPPVEYFAAIAKFGKAFIEACENYQKQSYRNRCTILTANGKMNLNIPVSRGGGNFTPKVPISEIEIDYSEDWVLKHTRALEAAYMNSPFFVYYKDDLYKILCSGERSLLKFNTLLTRQLLQFCGVKAEVYLTEDFILPSALPSDIDIVDLRERIHPKWKGESFIKEKPHWQVFSAGGFISGLSVVDLLFNEGPDSVSFLL